MFFMEKRNDALKTRLPRWSDSDDLLDFESRKSERESKAYEWKANYGCLSNDDVKDVVDDIVENVSHKYDSDDYFHFVDIFKDDVPKNFLKLGYFAKGMRLRVWFHVPEGSEDDTNYLLLNTYKFKDYVQRTYDLRIYGIVTKDGDVDFSEYEGDIQMEIGLRTGKDEMKGLSIKQYKRAVADQFVEGIDGFCKAMNKALEN